MARPVAKKTDMEEAAIRLFATKGLARTTIKDIASAAGVTEGALYRHWPGKEDMAWELFVRELTAFSRELGRELFGKGEPFPVRLRRAIRFMYAYYERQPVRFAFIMLTQHGFPEEHIPDPRINPNDMAVRFIEAAMDSGEIARSNSILAAGMVMGLAQQPLVMHRYGRLRLTDGTADEVASAAIRVLAG